MGPIAEEFHEAFGLGNNEKYISTVDIDGVALAAIQALKNKNDELSDEVQSIKNENEELRRRLEKIEAMLLEMNK